MRKPVAAVVMRAGDKEKLVVVCDDGSVCYTKEGLEDDWEELWIPGSKPDPTKRGLAL